MQNTGLNPTIDMFPQDNELLEQVFNNALLAIVIADNHLIIRRINPNFTCLFGYTVEEAVGHHLYELTVTKELREQQLCFESEQINKRLEKGEQVEFEALRCRKDGRMIHVLCRVSPIMRNNRKVGGVAFYSDITARKHAQEELQKANNELETQITGQPSEEGIG